MSVDLGLYFGDIEKKKKEDETKRQLEKTALLAQQKLTRVNDEKQFIQESILKHHEKFPTTKFPLFLTLALQKETLEWVATFDAATLAYVDVYMLCPTCKMGVFVSKHGKIEGDVDHCCQKIAILFCPHGETRSKTCGACFHEHDSGN